MLFWASKKVKELEQHELNGFIFKSKSPSSGMERVKVYQDNKGIKKNGIGMFARAFMDHFPLLPVEEDGRLHDIRLRENFIERIFVYKRWRNLLNTKKTIGGLVEFHTAHKLLLLSHSEEHYRRMGPLVAKSKKEEKEEIFETYEKELMDALKRKCTPRKHTNVLLHMLGYFKKHLTSIEKKEMVEIIDQFKAELIPLIDPITLFQHYIKKYNIDYLLEQYYINPHPLELKLRNHS
jgi:uncharacterized protein YbgA (DUF1722 family)